jgi:hypothetical protein
MRKRTKLPLTLAIMAIVSVGMMASTVVAAPPSSGTPTPISTYYGTIVIGTTFTPSGTQYQTNLYIFSTAGPFYVQKVNMRVMAHLNYRLIFLDSIIYDGSVLTNPQCSQVTNPPPYAWGDIIAVTPSTLIDPSGARAIPAAGGVQFVLSYDSKCGSPNIFPSTLTLTFEATVLAPTAATVSICVNEGPNPLTSCSAS